MAFVKVASKKDLPVGKKLGVKISGNELLIVNLNGKYYALGNKCTHKGCKLSDGSIDKESIKCPCHGSVFDIKNGKVLKGPANKPAIVFNVNVEDDQILIDV